MNLTYLTELSSGDIDFVRDMLETYLDQLPKDVALLRQSADATNLNNLGAIAHRMKSYFSTLGMSDLESLMLNLEKNTQEKNTDRDFYNHQIELLNNKLEHLYKQIKDYLARTSN